ncbi:MAG: hypothetical protein DHS20C21_19350 [Gemmatimonadota bacterium]|nr:MAG: hypothetical protein DHS20C21_19350 [Gemmatimonadota bacterium]
MRNPESKAPRGARADVRSFGGEASSAVENPTCHTHAPAGNGAPPCATSPRGSSLTASPGHTPGGRSLLEMAAGEVH